jgi:hypothetical protein
MQMHTKLSRRKKKAYILLVTLALLVVILITLATTVRWVTSNSTVGQRNNQFVASEYAAEAATEKVLGQMEYDWLQGTFGASTNYSIAVPTNTADWPIQYVFSDANGNPNQMSVTIGQQETNWVNMPSPYAGLKAFISPCSVTATATPIGQRFNVPATVSQTFDISSIPVFQYLIFYNMDLEIAAAQPLDLNGPVFSNAGLWSGSTLITFDSIVWAVSKTVVNGKNNPFVNYTGSGASTYNMKGQPVSGVNHETMPIAGTNNSPAVCESILQWPPAAFALGSPNAYTVNGEVYLANYADLIISNAITGTNSMLPKGTNLFVYYEDPAQPANSNSNNFCSSITWVTNDFYVLSNAATHFVWTTNYVPTANTNRILYAGYSFLTNVVFYDWREGWNGGSGNGGFGKTVQAVQFDIGKFNLWLAANSVNGGSNYNLMCQQDKNHSIGGVYVYNSVPLSTAVLPAVRVINGSQLFDSYGFSIATPMPLYVKGDFNVMDGSGFSDAATKSTAHSRPASFLADAITILSGNFIDNPSANTIKPGVNPNTTTIDAACLEGIVQSDPNLNGAGDSSNYSGGVENFLRLLESWGTLYYNGSIVVMFPSQYATNRWRQTGNFYAAPTRNWSFDTNFTVRAKLPPFTPELKATIRGTWAGN